MTPKLWEGGFILVLLFFVPFNFFQIWVVFEAKEGPALFSPRL